MRFRQHADAIDAMEENRSIDDDLKAYSLAMLGNEKTTEILREISLSSEAERKNLKKVHIRTTLAYATLLSVAVAAYYYSGEKLSEADLSIDEKSQLERIKDAGLACILAALTILFASNRYTAQEESRHTNSTHAFLRQVMGATREQYVDVQTEGEEVDIAPAAEDDDEVFVLASDHLDAEEDVPHEDIASNATLPRITRV